MIVEPNKNCSHIHSVNLLPIQKFNKIPFHLQKCENCSENKELWICLTCGKSFCGRYKNNHYYLHYKDSKSNSHFICISLIDLSVWCYECTTKGYDDPGSYIESPITNKYLDVISNFKFSANFCPTSFDIFTSLELSNEQIINFKYHNFIELLKNNKFSKVTFLVGAGISTSSGIPDFRGSNGVFQSIIKKYGLKRPEDFFSKKLFTEKPELLYEYLKKFKSKNYLPSLTHYFMRYLVDRNKCKFIFTQNFDGLESKAGIKSENIIFAHGSLTEGHCVLCDENIDINIINNGIMNDKVIRCPKCNGPCKPKIVLYSEDLPKKFYDAIDYVKECDLGIIIGTSLAVEPFSNLSYKFNKRTAWIVVIDRKMVGDFDYYNIYNNELFLQGLCDDTIKKILVDCKWFDDFKVKYNL